MNAVSVAQPETLRPSHECNVIHAGNFAAEKNLQNFYIESMLQINQVVIAV